MQSFWGEKIWENILINYLFQLLIILSEIVSPEEHLLAAQIFLWHKNFKYR